ncbi:MAG: glycosyltransferase family 39 protein, partial [Acidobacteriota bacterium]
LWATPARGLRPVRPGDLTTAAEPILHRLGVVASSPMLWAGGFLIGYLMLSWVLSTKGGASKRQRVLTGVGVGILALAARSANFANYPRLGGDELHNTWAGWNLIHEGSPKSWSRLPVYTDKTEVRYFSRSFPIVPKAFDHPPLLQLLAGGMSTLLGARNMFHCVPRRMRPLMVLTGTLGVLLLFLVAERLFDFPTAFLAAVLMAASPLVVFNGRLVKEEGLVQLFWLAATYVYLKLPELRRTVRWDYLCGAVLGLAALSKVHGGALGLAFAAVAVADGGGSLKRAARILVPAMAIAALYPLYGLLLDAPTYLKVLGWLSQRYPLMADALSDKFLIFPRFILEPKVGAGTLLIDGWILLGWLSLPHLFQMRPVAVPFIAYLLILVATVHSQNLYGFYTIPVLPFLCMAAGRQVRQAMTSPSLLSVFLFIALFFLPGSGRFAGEVPFGFRGLLVLACLPLAMMLFGRGRSWQIATGGMLKTMLILSVLAAVERCLTTL